MAGLLACSGSLHAPAPGHPVAQAAGEGGKPIVVDASGAGGNPASVSASDASQVTEALPLATPLAEAYPPDAQTYLLELARKGQTLFVRLLQRGGAACVAVELRPSLPDGTAGEFVLGGQQGDYVVHQGYLRVSRARPRRDFFHGETWPVHGTARDGVLLSGTLFSTSKEACEADLTQRPLALRDNRCGPVPELSKKSRTDADDMPWVFNGRGMFRPCRQAGAYFLNGTRYPIELFPPLAQAWITGPLAGGAGQPRVVDFRFESGHMKLGDVVLDHAPVVLSYPPADAEPALVETGVHDFAHDFLAEKRTLHVPLLRQGGVECAAVELSKLHGKFTVPTYSGRRRKLEYVKDDIGITVWHARFFQGPGGGRLGGTIAMCDQFPTYLSVHGRDADSYHVSGSRWFFDCAECERQRMRVLPSLVHVVNLQDDACGRKDARLVARPSVKLQTGTYYVRPRGANSCVPIEVTAPKRPLLESGRVRVPDASRVPGLESFTYDDVARGRYLWRSSADSLDGELLEMKPSEHGVQIGDTRWYRDKSSCEKAEAR